MNAGVCAVSIGPGIDDWGFTMKRTLIFLCVAFVAGVCLWCAIVSKPTTADTKKRTVDQSQWRCNCGVCDNAKRVDFLAVRGVRIVNELPQSAVPPCVYDDFHRLADPITRGTDQYRKTKSVVAQTLVDIEKRFHVRVAIDWLFIGMPKSGKHRAFSTLARGADIASTDGTMLCYCVMPGEDMKTTHANILHEIGHLLTTHRVRIAWRDIYAREGFTGQWLKRAIGTRISTEPHPDFETGSDCEWIAQLFSAAVIHGYKPGELPQSLERFVFVEMLGMDPATYPAQLTRKP